MPFRLSLLRFVDRAAFDRLPEGKHNLATYARDPAVGREEDEYVLTIPQGENQFSICFTAPSKVEYKPAGSALNIAVGLREIGASVRLVTPLVSVPHDLLSSDIRLYVVRRGIGLIEVSRPMTPVTFIIVDDGDDREKSAVLCYKPLYVITRRDAKNALESMKQETMTHVFATGIRMPELALVRKAFLHARKQGATTCFIPNPSILLSSNRDTRNQFNRVISLVDILQLNTKEAEAYFFKKKKGSLHLDDVVAIARKLRVSTLIVTRGEAGVWAVIDGAHYEVPAAPIARGIDTTGAGDAFLTGFVAARNEGRSPEDSLRIGALFGASNVMEIGGHGGMPSRAQFERFLN